MNHNHAQILGVLWLAQARHSIPSVYVVALPDIGPSLEQYARPSGPVNELPHKVVHIGYHRVSDDRILSSHFPPNNQRDGYIRSLLNDPDIDRVWWRHAAFEPHYLKGSRQ